MVEVGIYCNIYFCIIDIFPYFIGVAVEFCWKETWCLFKWLWIIWEIPHPSCNWLVENMVSVSIFILINSQNCKHHMYNFVLYIFLKNCIQNKQDSIISSLHCCSIVESIHGHEEVTGGQIMWWSGITGISHN